MKKILFTLLTLYSVIGCQSNQIHNISPRDIGAYSFNEIVLQGDAKVELLNGYDDLQADSAVKPIISINKRILTINVPKANNTFIENNTFIKVFNKKIRKITATDNSSVYAKNFKTPALTIIAKQNGSINMKGEYYINTIHQNGMGKINISWVNSKNLFISSNNNGLIYLGGIADKMIAKLTNDAKLEAKYLRVGQAEIFTTDRAIADVLVLDYLGGYAIDNSNIYYHKTPKKITVVTKDQGNIFKSDWMR